jgi:hypothetical protein
MGTRQGVGKYSSRTKTRRRGPNKPREAETHEHWFDGNFQATLTRMRDRDEVERIRRDALMLAARRGDEAAGKILLEEYHCHQYSPEEIAAEERRRRVA